MKYSYRRAPNPTEYSVESGVGTNSKDRKTIAKDIPCQEACPAKTNVPGYIGEIAKGNFNKAYKMNLEDNMFPGVLGRICTRPCETACRHNWTGIKGPVTICHLKRSSADHLTEDVKPLNPWFETSGKKVAVIGGGPTGLAAARELKRYGHSITIFEKEDHLGGMMIDGIPRFRLPIDTVKKEIDLIINSGINVKYNSYIDDKKMAQLMEEYDAVLVAAGTMRPRDIEIKDLTPDMGIPGLDFMKDYNSGKIKSMSGDVLVIGGGFTAVDCSRSSARAARKLVGEGDKVSIIYRRTEHHMAAEFEELEEIRKENIEIRTLASPVAVRLENGKLKGVIFKKNQIGKKDQSGKPAITPIDGSEYEEPCENLIIAIGQSQEWEILPKGIEIKEDQRSNNEKVFAAGDFLTGSNDVIHAVGEGKAVADIIDQYLMNEIRVKKHVSVVLTDSDGETGRYRDHDLRTPNLMQLSTLLERSKGDHEVELGYSEQEALENATRCYLCDYKLEINNDTCIHCNWCIEVAPRDCIKMVSRVFPDEDGYTKDYVEAELARQATFIHIDSDECIRCGKCLRVCPTEAISMKRANLEPFILSKGEIKRKASAFRPLQ